MILRAKVKYQSKKWLIPKDDEISINPKCPGGGGVSHTIAHVRLCHY